MRDGAVHFIFHKEKQIWPQRTTCPGTQGTSLTHCTALVPTSNATLLSTSPLVNGPHAKRPKANFRKEDGNSTAR